MALTEKAIVEKLGKMDHIDLKYVMHEQFDIIENFGELNSSREKKYISEIVKDRLYVSGKNYTFEDLKNFDIRTIITFLSKQYFSEIKDRFSKGGDLNALGRSVTLHHYNVLDEEDEIILPLFGAVSRVVKKAEGAVLLHCNAGKSRSGSFCVSHLMKDRQWRLKEAFKFVLRARSIMPNPSFYKQLIMYERILEKHEWKKRE